MQLIKLRCDCYVASDNIAEVTMNEHADTITVRTKDGIGHCMQADYGTSIYKTMDNLVREINEAEKNNG